MSETGAVHRSVVLPAAVETVWAALTDGGHLSAWLGGEVDVDAIPGGQIVVRDDAGVRRGVIVDFDPGRRLEVRWLPRSHRVGFLWGPDDEPAGSGGELELRLEPMAPGRTRLTVTEHAPASRPVALSPSR